MARIRQQSLPMSTPCHQEFAYCHQIATRNSGFRATVRAAMNKDQIARQNGQLLDACKARLGIASDYALAKEMSFPQQQLQHWRHGRAMNVRALYWVAQTLEADPRDLIAGYELEKAQDGAEREFWVSVLARSVKSVAKGAAKGVAIVALLMATVGYQATSSAIDAARRLRSRA